MIARRYANDACSAGRRTAWPCRVLLSGMLMLASTGHTGEPRHSIPATRATEPAALVVGSTRDIANRFIHSFFMEHDIRTAYGRYVSPGFIQHNPEIAGGLASELDFFSKRQQAHSEHYLPVEQWADVIDTVLVDGQLFAVHHHVFTNPNDRGRVFVDIWRVAEGKIVEHWDVIQPVPASPLNEATLWCAKGADYRDARSLGDTLASPTCGRPDIAANRSESLSIVDGYVRMMGGTEGPAGAVQRFFADDFTQHSPHIRAGKAALIENLTSRYGAGSATRHHSRVVRVLAEGDRVLLHRYVDSEGEPQGTAAVDIFQVHHGRIIAHWDVMQGLPQTAVLSADETTKGKDR